MNDFTHRFLNNNFILVLIILCAAFAGYAYMLGGEFNSGDDRALIVQNQDIRSFDNLGAIFRKSFFGSSFYFRPLVIVYFMIVYHFFGLNPFYYYLAFLLLHAATAVSVFWLVRHILDSQKIGFYVSLLFVLHPIHWEAVSTNSSDTLLCAFFYINAFTFYALSVRRHPAILYYIPSLVFYAAALLSKEYTVTFPLILLSFHYFLIKDKKNPWMFALLRVLPFSILFLVYYQWRQALNITQVYLWPTVKHMVLAFVIFLKSLIINFQLILWPVGLHKDRLDSIARSFFETEIVCTILFFFLVAILLLKNLKKMDPQVKFFLSWFCITMLPVSQIIPIGAQIGYISTGERFMYLSSVGIFPLIVLAYKVIFQRAIPPKLITKRALTYIAIGWFLFLLLTTMGQSSIARNKAAVYRQTLNYNPNNTRIRYMLGLEYVKKGLYDEAEWHFRRILAIDPVNVKATIALKQALKDKAGFKEWLKKHKAGMQEPLNP